MDNAQNYYRQPGYLHRYYLLRDDYMHQGSSEVGKIEQKVLSSLKEVSSELKKEENERLGSFAKVITGEQNPIKGMEILREIISGIGSTTKTAWDFILKYGYTNQYSGLSYFKKGYDKEEVKSGLLDISMQELTTGMVKNANYLKNIIDLSEKENDDLEKTVEDIINAKIGNIRMGFPATTTGNFIEKYLGLALNNKMVEYCRNNDYLENWSNNNIKSAVSGDIKMSNTTRLSPADVVISINGEECLPLQIKTDVTNKQTATLLRKATLSEAMAGMADSAATNYVRFAIIHQHYFSYKRYISLVDRVAEIRGDDEEYLTGSNPKAIESFDKTGVISGLEPAVDILKYLMAEKLITGVTEENKNLFYISASSAGYEGVMRTSDMIDSLITKNGIDRISKTGTAIGDINDNSIMKSYNSIRTREEWADEVGAKLKNTLDKISVTMTFNYSNMI